MQNKLSSHESSDENEVSVFNIRFISVRTRSIFESVLVLAVVYCFMIGICSIDEILVDRSFNLKQNLWLQNVKMEPTVINVSTTVADTVWTILYVTNRLVAVTGDADQDTPIFTAWMVVFKTLKRNEVFIIYQDKSYQPDSNLFTFPSNFKEKV